MLQFIYTTVNSLVTVTKHIRTNVLGGVGTGEDWPLLQDLCLSHAAEARGASFELVQLFSGWNFASEVFVNATAVTALECVKLFYLRQGFGACAQAALRSL